MGLHSAVAPFEICMTEMPHPCLTRHVLAEHVEIAFGICAVPQLFENDAQEILFKFGGAEPVGEEAGLRYVLSTPVLSSDGRKVW